jgi:hypothetical protein
LFLFFFDLAIVYGSLAVVKYLLEDETVLGVWNEFAMLKGRMDMEKEAAEEVCRDLYVYLYWSKNKRMSSILKIVQKQNAFFFLAAF